MCLAVEPEVMRILPRVDIYRSSKSMAFWIEITNYKHGGAGWEFGACFRSPVANKGGTKLWVAFKGR